MNAIDALVFVLGVYLLTLVVSLFVVVVIIGIRRITADRPKAPIVSTEKVTQEGGATA